MPETGLLRPTQEPPWSTLGAVQTVHRGDRTIEVECDRARLFLRILAPNLVRISLAPSGEFKPRRSWAVAKADTEWEKVSFQIEETPTQLELKTEAIRVILHKDPCRIECFDLFGNPFAEDIELNMGWRTGSIAAWKRIHADEHFYGFGEPTGGLDQLSKRRTHWTTDALDYTALTDAMYVTIPFTMAVRPSLAYGLFLNSTHWSHFSLGADKPGVLQMETRNSELDYYIIYGANPAQILQTYTDLTGRMPLPPRWALGYHQCRWSYDREEVVRNLAKEFRDRQIPCDVIHLDIDYMQGFRVFTWSSKRFPNPAKLIQELADHGFKTVVINDPGVKYELEADNDVLDEGLENDYFVRKADGEIFHGYAWADRSVFPDFMRPEVRQWWGSHHKKLTDVGIAGIWNDMNEPALNDRPFGDEGKKIPFPLDAPQGPLNERTNHAETHNLYGHMMARASREALNNLRPSERSFVLTRSGTAGVQQWAAVWTGDNHSLWEYLEMSIPMLCNLGLSGVPFVGADIGGFAGNATAELFARWIQLGMLYPFMRGHSMTGTQQHEPWIFGEEVEKISRQYIELRYQLLPYLYTLFWQATQTGAPILRPLVYEFPNDSKTYKVSDQVLLGSSLMAAPIYRPGVEHRAVYLPEGTWYDWWTGETYTGSTSILASAPLDIMPLYVRAGAIIPLGPVMQYSDERPLDELTLRVYPGTGETVLYEDDGRSFEYKNGAWATTTYRVSPNGEGWVVEVQAREGEWTPPEREVIVEVVGVGQQRFTDDGREHRLIF